MRGGGRGAARLSLLVLLAGGCGSNQPRARAVQAGLDVGPLEVAFEGPGGDVDRHLAYLEGGKVRSVQAGRFRLIARLAGSSGAPLVASAPFDASDGQLVTAVIVGSAAAPGGLQVVTVFEEPNVSAGPATALATFVGASPDAPPLTVRVGGTEVATVPPLAASTPATMEVTERLGLATPAGALLPAGIPLTIELVDGSGGTVARFASERLPTGDPVVLVVAGRAAAPAAASDGLRLIELSPLGVFAVLPPQ